MEREKGSEAGAQAVLSVAAWLDRTLRSRIAIAVILIAIAVHCGIVTSRRMGDFRVYHQAAQRLLAGEPIYRLDDPHRYLYAPIVTFLFVPLAPLPKIPAAVLWYLLNVWLLFSSLGIIERMVYRDARPPPGLRWILLLFGLRFVDNNLGHGQINILLLWLVLFAYDAAGRDKSAWAGLALAAAISMKLYPGVLLLQLLLSRRWRFLGATLAAGFLLLVAPIAWWGDAYPDVIGNWIDVVRDQATHYDVANKINQSISAFAFRLVPANAATATVLGLHVAFLSALAFVSLRSRRNEPPEGVEAAELALYILYATIASRYSWKYYFVGLLPAAAVVFRRVVERRQWGGAVALAVPFVLTVLPGLRLFGKELATLFQLWSFHFVSVAVLFVAILVSSRREAAAS